MTDNIYKNLSEERKKLQAAGLIPEWYSTGAFQVFKGKYDYDTNGRSVRGQFERISKAAAKHLKGTKFEAEAESKFFELMWNGWMSLSSPIMANMGTNRGLPVSCSGAVVDDSIHDFYANRLETAILTKNGFGTSAYLGNIRPRGSAISVGGKASGVVPVFKGHVQDMRDVAQGTSRRGAWAGYLEIDHGDFDELADFIYNEPDDCNIGWLVTDAFIAKLDAGDEESVRRFQKALKMKMVVGRGYFLFIDKVNRARPATYKDHGLTVKNANLCTEIVLFNDKDHTYTCIITSMNDARYMEWKDTDAPYWATIFLDCVAEEFLLRASTIPGLERAVNFTKKGRALGLGQMGLHTLFQKQMIPFESFEAHNLSQQISKRIFEEAERASREMAAELGEPSWCKGYGRRNTHLCAIAPTKSSSELMGGVSEGINPDPAMTYVKQTAAGDIDRINPELLALMKKKGVYTKQHIAEISAAFGSVQGVDWLDDYEKSVFKTAFEIDQRVILRMAAARKKAGYLDQWQSLNLYFSSDASEEHIASVHKDAFKNEDILGLYYIYSMAGVKGAEQNAVCEACSA